MYSQILKERMDANRQAQAQKEDRRKRRKLGSVVDEEDSDLEDKDGLGFKQPALVTGAQLKGYQLEGMQWMVSLHSNGISGILADEMGLGALLVCILTSEALIQSHLGKTLQTIAFSAYLREIKYSKPFMVVCPLSVLHNWAEEYAKFAPEVWASFFSALHVFMICVDTCLCLSW